LKASFGHIQFNINPENFIFYEKLMTFLGWKMMHQDQSMLAFGYDEGYSLWFIAQTSQYENDYDGAGVNHVAFYTSTMDEVDDAVDFLRTFDTPALFGTPSHRPEFSGSSDQTYYQVMFESPDRILFEIVYMGSM
jgi:catechol 2,3-dioxygenase-like lactoylglutathione lyase family enzyme